MTSVDLAIEEYKSLRAEQLCRMNHRTALITGSVTASAALIGIGLKSQQDAGSGAEFFLLVPLVSSVFGLLILALTSQIADIGVYIRLAIEQRINNSKPYSMGWHLSNDTVSKRFFALLGIWHLPIVLTTIAPSLVALSLFFTFQKSTGLHLGNIFILTVDIFLLVYFTVAYLHSMLGGLTPRREMIYQWRDGIPNRFFDLDDKSD